MCLAENFSRFLTIYKRINNSMILKNFRVSRTPKDIFLLGFPITIVYSIKTASFFRKGEILEIEKKDRDVNPKPLNPRSQPYFPN